LIQKTGLSGQELAGALGVASALNHANNSADDAGLTTDQFIKHRSV
jgi:hypothetical protein